MSTLLDDASANIYLNELAGFLKQPRTASYPGELLNGELLPLFIAVVI